MGDPTPARDAVVEAMEAEDSRHAYRASLGQLLDAVPTEALVALAAERTEEDDRG